MTNKEIVSLADKSLTPNYNRRPIALVKGKKANVWDAEGNKYIDFVSGLAVTNLGHSFSPITKAVQKQLGKLIHVSNLYHTEAQATYASTLVEKMGKGKIFLCNSGAEANEAALKLVRRYSIENFDKNRIEVIAFEGSFHGRTAGALSLTGQKNFRSGFGPTLSGVKFVPYGDLKAAEKAITKKTCAVFVEPIQGEFGIRVPTAVFLQGLAKVCAKKKVLLVCDEVQTGFGRVGKLFAYEHFRFKPDVVTMAKGIANGLPMGAMFAKNEVADFLTPGTHASTFGGGSATLAGASVALQELSSPELQENVKSLGRYMLLRLTGMKSAIPMIKEVRGLGLMIGIELDRPGDQLVAACEEKGLLVNCANENTIRMLPPLNITKTEVDKALAIFNKALGS